MTTDKGLVLYNAKNFTLVDGLPKEAIMGGYMDHYNRLWLFYENGMIRLISTTSRQIINTDSLFGLDKFPQVRGYWTVISDADDTLYLHKKHSLAAIPLNGGKSRYITGNTPENLQQLTTTINHLISRTWSYTDTGSTSNESGLDHVMSKTDLPKSVIRHNKIAGLQQGKPYWIFDGNNYNITDYITGFARNDHDLLIACMTKGLWVFEHYDPTHPASAKPRVLLSGEYIHDICADYMGNIWVATAFNGLYLFSAAAAKTVLYEPQRSGELKKTILNIVPLPGNKMALCYNTPAFDIVAASGSMQHFTLSVPGISENTFVQTVIAAGDTLIVFTAGNIYRCNMHQPVPATLIETANSSLLDFHRYHDKVFYTRYRKEKINYIDKNGATGELPHPALNSIFRFCIVNDSTFYSGTADGIYYNETKIKNIPESETTALVADSNYLFAANLKGIVRITLPDRSGTPQQATLLNDKPCHIILTSADHTSCYDISDNGIITINAASGMASNYMSLREYDVGASVINAGIINNTVWLTTNDGVLSFPESQLAAKPTLTPRIFITSGTGQHSITDTSIRLQYRKDLSVILQVDVLDYNHEPNNTWYSIRRDGQLITASKVKAEAGSLPLNNPAPGDYTVSFIVQGQESGYEVQKSIQIIITPLWYQTTWCRLVLLLAITALLAWLINMIIRIRYRKMQQALQRKTVLLEKESQALYASLKPHFVFNAIGPLQSYILKKKNEEALTYLSKLSRLMRDILNQSRSSYNTLQHKLVFLHNYIDIQQERFGNTFTCTINVDPQIDTYTTMVPGMMVQPLLENAIEHGVKGMQQGVIQILFDLRQVVSQEVLYISITDNGTGFPEGTDFIKENHALQLIVWRMELIKEETGTGTIHFGNQPRGGAIVELWLPVIKNTHTRS